MQIAFCSNAIRFSEQAFFFTLSPSALRTSYRVQPPSCNTSRSIFGEKKQNQIYINSQPKRSVVKCTWHKVLQTSNLMNVSVRVSVVCTNWNRTPPHSLQILIAGAYQWFAFPMIHRSDLWKWTFYVQVHWKICYFKLIHSSWKLSFNYMPTNILSIRSATTWTVPSHIIKHIIEMIYVPSLRFVYITIPYCTSKHEV